MVIKRTSEQLTEELLRSTFPEVGDESIRVAAEEVVRAAEVGPTDEVIEAISRRLAPPPEGLRGADRGDPGGQQRVSDEPRGVHHASPGLRPVVVSSGSTLLLDGPRRHPVLSCPLAEGDAGPARDRGLQSRRAQVRKPYWYLPLSLAVDIVGVGLPLMLAMTASSGAAAYHYAAVSGLTWAAIQAMNGRYDRRRIGERVAPGLIFRDWLTFVGTLSTATVVAGIHISLGLGLLALLPGVFVTASQRYLLRRHLVARRRKAAAVQHVLLLGTSHAVDHIVARLSRRSDHDFDVVGACLIGEGQVPEAGDAARAMVTASGVPVVAHLPSGSAPKTGDAAAVVHAIRASQADLVLVAPGPDMSDERLHELSWALRSEGCSLAVAPALTEVAEYRLQVASVAGLTVLHVMEPERRSSDWLRRLADRTGALVLLLLFAPLLAGIALAVYLTSRGPVLHRQERVGYMGKPFTLLKFRTMVADADSLQVAAQVDKRQGPRSKMHRDPRITSIGRILRAGSWDELPQLINVLRGDMSLVGPRPPLPDEVERYDEAQLRQLAVKPGLTGQWAISGRTDLTRDEALDLRYIENPSLRGDISTIMATMRAVADTRESYG
ncbi:exopolysaccharide biosynthesis polyprenyl glycosylphosphotransferase [Streptomyces sp. NPDC004647]|uniref:exopolysaccharide biosynthesis polyprenyl glycosylphosphotransferase n=1 Tax=Streptomyces sp. NPDC004647 TaxID=3154671 RepID=UPI0033BA3EEC